MSSEERDISKLPSVEPSDEVGFTGEWWQRGEGEAKYFGDCGKCGLFWGAVHGPLVTCSCGTPVEVQAKEP